MVFGLIADADKASSLLDNLSEADFDNVSLIMNDEKVRNTITSDTGPLKGVTMATIPSLLQQHKFSESEIHQIVISLQQGNVLVAIQTDKNFENAVVEMLKPYKAQHIKIV